MSKLLSIKGTPLIGLYIKVTESSAVLGINDVSVKEIIEEALDVNVVVTTISGSELVGALAVANSSGIVVNELVLRKELDKLKKVFDKVYTVKSRITCLGNVFCVNDKGGLAHPEVDNRLIEKVSEFLDIDIIKGTIGGIKTVGMAATVTNKGGLLNPNANEWEIKKVKEVLKVNVGLGTVNFGSDMVGTGLVANSKGYIAGEDTTGFELGVVEEALGFI